MTFLLASGHPGTLLARIPVPHFLLSEANVSNAIFLGCLKFSASSGFMFLSVQRLLDRDAETSSDDAKGRVSITGYGVS